MFICICNGITERQIREAVCAGASTLPDLSIQLGVATCCGTCACAAEQVIREARQQVSPTAQLLAA